MGEAATQQRDWLTILNAPSVGGASLIGLIEKLGGVTAVVSASARNLVQQGFSEEAATAITRPDAAVIDAG